MTDVFAKNGCERERAVEIIYEKKKDGRVGRENKNGWE